MGRCIAPHYCSHLGLDELKMNSHRWQQVRHATWVLRGLWRDYHKQVPHQQVRAETPRNLDKSEDHWPNTEPEMHVQADKVRQLFHDPAHYDRWKNWRGIGRRFRKALHGEDGQLTPGDMALLFSSGAVVGKVPGPRTLAGEPLQWKKRRWKRWKAFVNSYSGLMRAESNATTLSILGMFGYRPRED